MNNNKQLLLLLGGAGLLVFIVITLALVSFFRAPRNTSTSNIPTPTAVPYTKNKDGIFTFTPLQKTIINRTTEDEIEGSSQVISKSRAGNTTVYKVKSATIGETDEIRTKDGVVVFESTNIFNKKTGAYPPKISVYEKEFGQPQKVLKGVSPLGKYISAYIYASDGFTLFANPNTNTVYVVQRYAQMSLEEYEKTYPDYLRPAPDFPKEAPKQ